MKFFVYKISVLIIALSVLVVSLSFAYNQFLTVQNKKIGYTDRSSCLENLDSSYYENIFRNLKETSLGEPDILDLTGDGKDEVVFINISEGCASCHDHYLHIFEEKKEIFSTELDDPEFIPIRSKGFVIYEPIRKDAEPYCCPTSFKRRIFEWNGDSFIEKSK